MKQVWTCAKEGEESYYFNTEHTAMVWMVMNDLDVMCEKFELTGARSEPSSYMMVSLQIIDLDWNDEMARIKWLAEYEEEKIVYENHDDDYPEDNFSVPRYVVKSVMVEETAKVKEMKEAKGWWDSNFS